MDTRMESVNEINLSGALRRRQLLPLWIKVFVWIFLIMQGVSILMLAYFLIGSVFFGLEYLKFNLAVYGLETTEPASVTGLIIMLILQLKGITAFGLWTEKDWAIKLALADALFGIVFCLFMMLIYPFMLTPDKTSIKLRLELLILIPYFYKLRKIKTEWELLKK